MATKRMFSKTITNSARFLKMPVDSQCLYFHLGLNADDDGIVEAYPILKITGSSEDNLRVLAAKNFIRILNEDLVAHITDWNEHNLIRSDRKVDSIYKGLLLQVIPEIELIEPRQRADVKKRTDNGQPMDSIGKVRLGKVRLGKDRIDQDSIDNTESLFAFETFWKVYDKKTGYSKCKALWLKINPDAYPVIFAHAGEYVSATPDKKFRKDPATYLKNQGWLDEIIRPQSTPVKPSIQDRLKANEELCNEI